MSLSFRFEQKYTLHRKEHREIKNDAYLVVLGDKQAGKSSMLRKFTLKVFVNTIASLFTKSEIFSGPNSISESRDHTCAADLAGTLPVAYSYAKMPDGISTLHTVPNSGMIVSNSF